ncbi:hypothetical protein [Paenibacillus sp. FSL R10-2734]|uniref:hypothetical protein n=1 Tax=Paenibacillus sp. FSL R10-2734 TaxID=2954691 RepID=UPI0030DC6340
MERDKDKEDILMKMYDYIHLGQRLRSNGCKTGVGYDTSWDSFASKVNEFVGES